MRLMYTNSGGALLALTYNAVHKLWKWPRNEHNVAGKVVLFEFILKKRNIPFSFFALTSYYFGILVGYCCCTSTIMDTS